MNSERRPPVDPPRAGSVPGASDASNAALLTSLKSLALDQLGDRLTLMFDRADARLLDRAERAASGVQRRAIFEGMRALQQHRHGISSRFCEQIVAGFSPRVVRIAGELEISIDDLALREARVVEESIAFSNMETKAADRYKAQLWDLDRRLEWLIEARKMPIARDALTPATLGRAFRHAVDALQLELDSALVIFQLFESEFLLELQPFFDAVLRLLNERGVKAAPLPPPRARDDAGRAPGGAAAGTPGSAPGAAPWRPGATTFGAQLDAQTLALLSRFAAAVTASVPAYYGDANLAHDLETAARGYPVSGWPDAQSRHYAQRAGLVGLMFNELTADLSLEDDETRCLDLLRFAVIKRSLRDPRFFTDPEHPVRRLVNDLVTMIAVSHATGGDMGERIDRLVAEVRAQFDDAAASLRTPARVPEPIDPELAERFSQEQASLRDGRRRAVVSRVREIVAAELRLRLGSLSVPEAARPLLYGGWSVLMAHRLTYHGLDSAEWKQGIDLLNQVLRFLMPLDGQTPEGRELSQLGDELHEKLMHVGLPREKVDSMIRGFWQAMEERGHQRIALVASRDGGDPLAAREALVLELLLVPGRWFHLHDASQRVRRWLRYVGPESEDGSRLRFAEFDGNRPMTIAREALLEDLAAQRSEPIDLPPNCRRAFDTMVARRARMRAA